MSASDIRLKRQTLTRVPKWEPAARQGGPLSSYLPGVKRMACGISCCGHVPAEWGTRTHQIILSYQQCKIHYLCHRLISHITCKEMHWRLIMTLLLNTIHCYIQVELSSEGQKHQPTARNARFSWMHAWLSFWSLQFFKSKSKRVLFACCNCSLGDNINTHCTDIP